MIREGLPQFSMDQKEIHFMSFDLTSRNKYRVWVSFKKVKLLFLTFSALVANPKKLLYTVANSARGLLNTKKKKKKVWQRHPPPPRAARSEKRKRKKRNHAAHPHSIGT